MKLEQWFVTPIALDKLKISESISLTLKKYILDAEKIQGEKNTILTQFEKDDVFESQWDLFKRDNEAIQYLKKEIYNRLIFLVSNLNSYPAEITNSIKIKDQSWFHVTRNGGYFTNHNHPMASWSCVYCVDEGDSLENSDSGVTRFFPPSLPSNYLDAGNANLKFPFSSSSMNIKLRTNDLIFFPSNIMHEVSPYLGKKERITIASNFWFESDKIQIRI